MCRQNIFTFLLYTEIISSLYFTFKADYFNPQTQKEYQPSIPNHQFLIVSNRPEEGLVQEVPRDVLHHGRVSREHRLRLYDAALLGRGVDVPQADCVVIAVMEKGMVFFKISVLRLRNWSQM